MSAPANFNGAKPIIDPANVVMLLIDHQSGLFQTIRDMPFTEVRTNATVLAKVANLANIPVITSASVPAGAQWPTDLGSPQIRATCAVRRAPRRDQRVGQPGVCGSGKGHGQEATHHRRHDH